MEFIPAALLAGLVGTSKYWKYLDKIEKRSAKRTIDGRNEHLSNLRKKEVVNSSADINGRTTTSNKQINKENRNFPKKSIEKPPEKKSRYEIRLPEFDDFNENEDILVREISQKQGNKGVEFPTERKCREIFENILGMKFPKRWDIIKNPRTGRWLELDGYCERLRIAMEVQGAQHYHYPHPFWKNVREFRKAVYRDKVKVLVCRKMKINLIIIPYTENKRLEKFIIKKLQEIAEHNPLIDRRLREYLENRI